MKNLSILTIIFLLSCNVANTQERPLKGSGKLVNKTFVFTNFNKIYLADLDGEVTITAGQSFSISVTVDDNLEAILSVKEAGEKLTVAFDGNRNNKRYIEKTNVRIAITLPSLLFLENDGNASVTVTGITGASFTIDNLANGSTTLSGAVDNIEIRKTGNGNVNAQALAAQKAIIKASGNGSIQVNTNNDFSITATGNGSISNTGTGLPSATSALNGNAGFIGISTKKVAVNSAVAKTNSKLQVYFTNKTQEDVKIKIAWPVSGNYGNTIPANKTVTEMLPPGTTIKSRGLKSDITITQNNQEIIFE